MGFHTDILIADPHEAQEVADSESPTAERDGFTFIGFDRVQLCTLLSLLKSGTWDSCFEYYLEAIDVVRSSTNDWPVVSVLKPKEVAELAAAASLESSEFQRVATSWAATEEFEGWAGSDVRDLLQGLVDLADSAALQKKCIMIWQSP